MKVTTMYMFAKGHKFKDKAYVWETGQHTFETSFIENKTKNYGSKRKHLVTKSTYTYLSTFLFTVSQASMNFST